jgi:hypothetical protein
LSQANRSHRPLQRKPSEPTLASKTLSTASLAALSRPRATGYPFSARVPSARPFAGRFVGCSRRFLGLASSRSVCRRNTRITDAGRSTTTSFAEPDCRQRIGERRQAVAQHRQARRTRCTLHHPTFPCTNHRPPLLHPTLAWAVALRGRSRSSWKTRHSAQALVRVTVTGLWTWSRTTLASHLSLLPRPLVTLGGRASTNVLQPLRRRPTHL